MGRTRRPLVRAGITLAVLAATAAMSGCTGGSSTAAGSNAPASPAPPTASTASMASASKTRHPAAKALNPLTGLKSNHNPVIAVKIDDTGYGRPQVGVDQAD